MKDNIFDILENDVDTALFTAENYPDSDTETMKRVFEQSEKKYLSQCGEAETVGDQVSGVVRYHRSYGWLAAAAAVVIAAGAGGIFAVKSISDHVDVYSSAETEPAEEVTEEIFAETSAVEEDTAEAVKEYEELELHTPKSTVTDEEENLFFEDEKYSRELNLNDRRRVDTERYKNQILSAEGDELNSLENKSYIYHMMLNSVDYFDTVSGKMTYGLPETDGCTYQEFMADIPAQYCHETSSNMPNADTCINEKFVYDGVEYDIDHNENTFCSMFNIPSVEFSFFRDNYRVYVGSDGYNCANYRPDWTNLGVSATMIFPQAIAMSRLNEFDSWSIDRTEEMLGRSCAVVKGESIQDWYYTYTAYIDLDTGIMLHYEEYDQNDYLKDSMQIHELHINEELEKVYFDPAEHPELEDKTEEIYNPDFSE